MLSWLTPIVAYLPVCLYFVFILKNFNKDLLHVKKKTEGKQYPGITLNVDQFLFTLWVQTVFQLV